MSADTTMWSSEAWSSAADEYLLGRVREGSAEAFGELWRRHLPAAYAVANRHRGRAAAEDIVAEAATRVFTLLAEGRGPDEHFRAYFLTAVRTVAVDMARRDLRLVPTEDDDLEVLTDPTVDETEAWLCGADDLGLVREAFRGLPERDQRVLWHTTVEGAAPRVVAPALGLTANAVSARAVRARDALRTRYLDAHAGRGLRDADSEECRWVLQHLGAHVRGRLPRRQGERVALHLETCPHAATIATELRAIHEAFPALVVPLVLAAGLGTPGFVTGAGLAGLTGAVGVGAAGVGAAGAGAAASPAGVAGAAGATGAVAEAGGVGAGAAGVSGGGAVGGGSAVATSPTSAFGADTLAQLASKATTLAAGVAVAVGVAAAGGAPGGDPAPSAAVVPPAVTGPTSPGGASATPAPSVVSPTSPTATSPSAVPVIVAPTSAPPTAGTPTPPGTTAARPSATAALPAPTSTRTPSTPPPAPTSSPGTQPTVEPTADVSARLVRSGETSRFSLQVSGAADLRFTVSNVASAGTLTVSNDSHSCTNTNRWTVSCTSANGRLLLDQSGLGGLSRVVVRVTSSAGTSSTVVLPS